MRGLCWDRCGRPGKRQRYSNSTFVWVHTQTQEAWLSLGRGSSEEDLKSPSPKRLQACLEGPLGYYNVNEIPICRNGRKF